MNSNYSFPRVMSQVGKLACTFGECCEGQILRCPACGSKNNRARRKDAEPMIPGWSHQPCVFDFVNQYDMMYGKNF